MVRVICRIKPPLRNNTKIIESDKLLFDKKEKDLKKNFKLISKVIKLDKFYDYDVKNNHIFKNEIVRYYKVIIYSRIHYNHVDNLFCRSRNITICEKLFNTSNTYICNTSCIYYMGYTMGSVDCSDRGGNEYSITYICYIRLE